MGFYKITFCRIATYSFSLNLIPNRFQPSGKCNFTHIKNVTFNEPQFTGHFPSQPIMPGVLIIEALAQATGILAFKSEVGKPKDGQIYMLVGVDKARFKRMVEPGDQLRLEVEVLAVKRGMWKFSCKALVNGKAVASAELMCTQKAAE